MPRSQSSAISGTACVPQAVQVVLVRDKSKTGCDVALVSTDLAASTAQIIERYASRWSIEVSIEDAKQLGGVGQARNRLQAAVERTAPLALAVNTLAVCWYAAAAHHQDDIETAAPWYREKTQPSVLDMLAKLRRVIIAAQYRLLLSRSLPLKQCRTFSRSPSATSRWSIQKLASRISFAGSSTRRTNSSGSIPAFERCSHKRVRSHSQTRGPDHLLRRSLERGQWPHLRPRLGAGRCRP